MLQLREKTIAWVMEKTIRRRRYWRLHRAIYMAMQRVSNILVAHGVEGAELTSIVIAFSWFLPLCLNPYYLQTSPTLYVVQQHLPYAVFVFLSGFLFFYQLGAIVLGGSPSYFINSRRDVVFWLGVRRWGIFIAGLLWMALAVLLTAGMITFGSVFFSGISIFCAIGWFRLSDAYSEEYQYRSLRTMDGGAQDIPSANP
jgi:hypothetical protein